MNPYIAITVYGVLYLIIVLEIIYKPRVDLKEEDKIIFWYGLKSKRKYFVIHL